MSEVCPYCGAQTPIMEGPTHEYILSPPGCWATLGSILEKEFSHPDYMKVHRLTVDAYGCQHPGNDEPKANQSVIVHLVALHLALEKKMAFDKIPKFMAKLISTKKGTFERLDLPCFDGVLNVTDVAKAKTAEEHCQLVQQWASQVWSAWSTEHQRIETMVQSLM